MQKYDARKEIESLKISLASLESAVKELASNHIPHLEAKIDILTTQMSGRPSWTITIIITLLTGLCSFLGTQLLSRLH